MEENVIIAETERLILRRYKETDLEDLYEYLSNEEVVKYEPYKVLDMDEVKQNLEWRISTDEMIAVELKRNHKMIGNIYLGKREFDSCEIGYVFNKDFPEQISKVMISDSTKGGNWFVDFKAGNTKYVVFRDKILKYEIGNQLEKENVYRECRKMGISDDEMNWTE